MKWPVLTFIFKYNKLILLFFFSKNDNRTSNPSVLIEKKKRIWGLKSTENLKNAEEFPHGSQFGTAPKHLKRIFQLPSSKFETFLQKKKKKKKKKKKIQPAPPPPPFPYQTIGWLVHQPNTRVNWNEFASYLRIRAVGACCIRRQDRAPAS